VFKVCRNLWTTATNEISRWLVDLPVSYAIVWLALWAIGSVLVVSLAEELLFCGYLLRKLLAIEFETVDPRLIT
jgi:membrane protease YdiL (CAAX protease family)